MDIQNKLDSFIDDLKDQLSFGNKTLLGLDIGQSAIKFSEVSFNGKEFKLERFSSYPLPEASIIDDEIQKENEIVAAIQTAYKNGEFESKHVCLGISGPNTIARKLQLAGGTEEEIEDQVIWEAEQYLPFAIEDCNLDFFNLGENEGGGVDVIIAAAKKEILLNYKGLVEASGLKVKRVDLSQIALCNIFELAVYNKISEDEVGSWIVIDLGAQKTQVLIFKNNTPIFMKEIDVGGSMITEEIQRQLGVNYFEAEDLKITGDENGNLPEEILEIIDDVVEAIFGELKKTIDFYISSTSDDSFLGCSITGGSSLIPGLVEGIKALLNVDVEVLNPFDGIKYDKKFSEEEINDIAFKGCVVLGLGLGQTDK